jgi:hypothetical protein
VTDTDPAERRRAVEAELIQQNAKLRPVDHNGVPIPTPPEPTDPHRPATS